MPNRILALVIVFVCGLTSLPVVFSQSQSPTTDDAKLRERAMKLHREAIVIDTHNDITSPITDEGFELPEGMEDISKLPAITYELLKRGYSEADVKKVLGENFLRTMAEVERVAKSLQASGAKPSTAKIGAIAKS